MSTAQDLASHLTWSPPELFEEDFASGSEYTRAPAFWDTHLHESLILKQIVCLPSLVETLETLVDDLLTKLKEDGTLDRLYEIPNMFPSESVRRDFPNPRSMTDEASVVNYYANTTAHIYSRIASALEFQSPNDKPILTWTQSHRHETGTKEANKNNSKIANPSRKLPKASKSSKRSSKAPKVPDTYKAIADGFLRINWKHINISSLSPDKRRGLEALRKHFANLAVWEFKSVAAGSLDVMQAIANLAGKRFCWTTCSETGYKCTNASHLQKNGIPKVTQARTGPDATDAPWKIPITTTDIEEEVSPKVDHAEQGDKRASNTTQNPRVPKASNDSDMKAHHILQQAWAESVHGDTTLIVIQSGNFEFIGVRHRATQTLYLSPLRRTHGDELYSGPSYGKLHTGLYIAAFRDTMNRAVQIADSVGPFPYIVDPDRIHEIAQPPDVAFANPVQWLKTRPSVSISIRYAGKLLEAEQYWRVCESIVPQQELEDPFTTIKIIFGKQIADSAHEAKVTLYGHPFITNAIAKLASCKISRMRLRNEYLVCTTLAKRGVQGTVPVVGLYHNITGGMLILLMENGGKAMTGKEKTKKRIDGAFESILENIHQAGYIHNSLSRSRLLISSVRNATVCIVGFADAKPMERGLIVGSEGDNGGGPSHDGAAVSAQAKEMALLKEILAGPRDDDEDYISKRSRFLRETGLLLSIDHSGGTSTGDELRAAL